MKTRTSEALADQYGAGSQLVTRLTVNLNPVPASRPRVSRWGTYYAKTYKTWMAAADKAIPHAESTHSGALSVELDLHVTPPKTTARDFPRGDIDNYTKAVLDALTKKGYWNDDDQITKLKVTKTFGQGAFHLVIRAHTE